MKKTNSNQYFVIIIVFITFIMILRYNYIQTKSKDVVYVAERYLTTGIFNSYKLYTINNFDITFSDSKIVVAAVKGTQKKEPHKKVTYKLFMVKNKAGIWKVNKIYTDY